MPYKTFEVTRTRRAPSGSCSSTLFWTMEFVEALGQIIVATAAATYYFTRDRARSAIDRRRGAHATWYHAGTAAFGSFIIAVIKIIKAILMYIQRKCENAIDATGDGPVQRMQKVATSSSSASSAASGASKKCMKFINKEAYIQTAIFGHPFCTAAAKGLLPRLAEEARRLARSAAPSSSSSS